MAAVEEHDEDVLNVEISRESSLDAWMQLAVVLGHQYVVNSDPDSALGIMGMVAELFCRHPEQMFAWWQLVKATGFPTEEALLGLFGTVIQDHYERGLMRAEVVR